MRMQGCRQCEQLTSGDCGMHGPVVIPANGLDSYHIPNVSGPLDLVQPNGLIEIEPGLWTTNKDAEKWRARLRSSAEGETPTPANLLELRAEAHAEMKPAGWTCPVCGLCDRRYHEDILARLKQLEGETPTVPETLNAFLESHEFYEVMQAYRTTKWQHANKVVAAFEAVKSALRASTASKSAASADSEQSRQIAALKQGLEEAAALGSAACTLLTRILDAERVIPRAEAERDARDFLAGRAVRIARGGDHD